MIHPARDDCPNKNEFDRIYSRGEVGRMSQLHRESWINIFYHAEARLEAA
jgi:hypothetical protein